MTDFNPIYLLGRAVIDALGLYKSQGHSEIADKVLMNLGGFEFFAGKKSYEKISKKSAFRWNELKVLNAQSFGMYTGEDLSEIEIEGIIYTALIGKKGLNAMDELKSLAKEPLLMVDGLGNNLGKWVILNVSEELSNFTHEGIAKKISFKVSLRRYER